jgi:hypothetical protein
MYFGKGYLEVLSINYNIILIIGNSVNYTLTEDFLSKK